MEEEIQIEEADEVAIDSQRSRSSECFGSSNPCQFPRPNPILRAVRTWWILAHSLREPLSALAIPPPGDNKSSDLTSEDLFLIFEICLVAPFHGQTLQHHWPHPHIRRYCCWYGMR